MAIAVVQQQKFSDIHVILYWAEAAAFFQFCVQTEIYILRLYPSP